MYITHISLYYCNTLQHTHIYSLSIQTIFSLNMQKHTHTHKVIRDKVLELSMQTRPMLNSQKSVCFASQVLRLNMYDTRPLYLIFFNFKTTLYYQLNNFYKFAFCVQYSSAHMYVHHTCARYQQKPKAGIRSHGNSILDGCAPPCGCFEPNPGSLQEQ